jgi:N-acetylneuraminate synthase
MVKIIAEIGINHNGSIEECKKMMMLSKVAGCDYAKIQKRNPDVCVPEHQKSVMRQTPWGEMTYLEYKYRMEFNEEQIKELCDFAKEIDIEFFASVWDLDSVALMAKYTKIVKLGSPVINDLELLKATRAAFDYVIMSTGMSTEEEIEKAVEACNPDVIMHTNSTYPCPEEELNLRYIEWLKTKYPTKSIGYSGHEYRLATTTAAVALGAEWVERHITLDRNTWGSDHKSSIEPAGLFSLVLDIKAVEKARQYEPQSRMQFEGENAKKKTLRRDVK